MKKFRFRLNKIEKLRKDRKKKLQRALAEADRQESMERDELRRLSLEAQLRRERAKASQIRTLNIDRLRCTSDYLRQLDFFIVHQEKRVTQAADHTTRRRNELKEASKEVKKLERLEEIRREQYNKNAESVLQKDNDEIAANISRSKSRSAVSATAG